ncbi:type II toxin-antitoxin system RelE/ParE family toxin [Jannaschia formosa]|uniref:type II toxin-antitoxin system RelE/ParE family toxin n=1 Tax=Jannaschia formosa TaxID=2259592 RepID=UPI000E1C2902|nr:type II toxin-antitoxin system RelE/ParE family toxin [Jannaschia formosa]TFL17367.1 type II toxin-antitoxin system RelE/ParE family toxin [Jannaschia formosa]
MKLHVRRAAVSDMAAIRAHDVATWGHDRTLAFLDGLFEKFQRLLEMPRMGRPREAVAAGPRSLRYSGYQIFYVIKGGRVVIVATYHERRNLAALNMADRLAGL